MNFHSVLSPISHNFFFILAFDNMIAVKPCLSTT